MRAAFTLAAWYRVEAVCKSPLRLGGTENDVKTILRDPDGHPMIQGSSLAGALREWLEKSVSQKNADGLFGSSSDNGKVCPGRLRLSDGTFAGKTGSVLRPRLKLDVKTRTADGDAKFDMAHIPTGTRFFFDLYWLGTKAQADELQTVESLLSALHSGEVRLGAQKSSGFGKVSIQYRKKVYNLFDAQARQDWLDKRPPDDPPVTPQLLTHGQRVQFTLRFRADSLLVKAGTEDLTTAQEPEDKTTGKETEKEDSMVTRHMKEAGFPVIPGSSVKGAVRARIEQIAALLGLPPKDTEALFGRMGSGGEDTGVAGRVRFDDIRLPSMPLSPIRRIHINRFTGGVIRSGLFSEEPVSTGKDTAKLRVSVPAELETGCALLLYALRDLAWNLYGLGSGRSIGRGNLRAEELEICLPDGETARYQFHDGFRCQAEGAEDTITRWLAKLEAEGVHSS